jgi:hypothetical protein
MTQSQKEFEVWAESKGYKLEKCKNHSYYRSASTSSAWQTWQASRAALVVELPDYEVLEWGEFYYKHTIEEALDKAGVKYKLY